MKTSVRKIIIACLVLAALLLTTSLHAHTHVWSGGALFSENWNSPANWSSGGVPSANEAAPVIIEFPSGFNGSSTNNIPGLRVDALRFLGSGVMLQGANGAALTLTGRAGTNVFSAGVNYMGASQPLILEGNNRLASPVLLGLLCPISGSGGLTIDGGVQFSGAHANSYTGTTVVRSGVLTLNCELLIIGQGPLGLVSVPGPLVIEGGLVTYSSDNGIADDAPVTIETGATLRLNGHDDTIRSLNLSGATVETGAGTLTLGGNVTAQSSSSIAGKLSLGAGNRTFDVAINSILVVSAVIGNGLGITHPGIIKTGNGELQLNGANTFTGLTSIQSGTVELRHSHALGSTLFNGTTVADDATLALFDGLIVLNKALTLNGGTLRCNGDSAWTGPITLHGDCRARSVSAGQELALTGVIGGDGDLTHNGNGKLTLGGTNSNTFTGTLTLSDGLMELAKSDGATAVSGDLVIGGPFHTNNANFVFLTAPEQIAQSATVTVLGSGLLHLNGMNETVGRLIFHGGEVQTGTGILTLADDVLVNPSSQAAKMDGKISLGSSGRVFDVRPSASAPALEISAVISGTANASLHKQGGGELDLLGNNTYSGLTTVEEGWLVIRHAHALGDANPLALGNGTVVLEGATLALDSVVNVPEKLALNGSVTNKLAVLFSQAGDNSWSGPISLSSNCVVSTSFHAPLQLLGVLSGNGGLTKVGMADLTLGGNAANTFAGATRVESGRLLLDKPLHMAAIPASLFIGDPAGGADVEEVLLLEEDQIAGSATVTVQPTGRLNLGNHDEAFSQLLGAGEVVLGYGRLTVARGSFDGAISGLLGSVALSGNEVLSLNGTNTYTGDTMLFGGTMLVNGSTANSTFYVTNNAVLGGHGSVGSVHLDGGRLAPGGLNSTGKLRGKGIYLKSGSTFVTDLNGELPGTQHDQLISSTTVQLQGKLWVKLNGNTASGDVFVIIKKDGVGPVSGTFQDLPEGQTFYVNSRPLQISYTGGDGNDVVLRQTGQAVSSHVTGVSTSPSGDPVIAGTGIPFQLYNVERSFDLETWTPLDTVAANDAGTISYQDGEGFVHPQAFYRFLAVDDRGEL